MLNTSHSARLDRVGHNARNAVPKMPSAAAHWRGQRNMAPPAPRRSLKVAAAGSPVDEADAEAAAKAGWDPEGLFATATSTDHFARRERQRAAAAAAAAAARPPTVVDPLQPVPPEHSASGGHVAADGPGYTREHLAQKLRSKFMDVNLDYPGLSVLHMDPAVMTIDNFMTGEECNLLIQAAQESGRLQVSKVGAGSVASSNYDSRRTSCSMLADPPVLAASAAMKQVVATFHQRAVKLLDPEQGRGWGRTGVLPAIGQYCFESPQIARYHTAQYFLSHEDGFPTTLARQNRFQRHGTLLLYLNDVNEGGSTQFDYLGLAVKPVKGKALLFFPSYSDGRPDERTLHAATNAVDTKWVMQQWIVRGYAPPAPASTAAAAPSISAARAPPSSAAAAAATPAPGARRQEAAQQQAGSGRSSSSSKTTKAKKKGSSSSSKAKGFGAK